MECAKEMIRESLPIKCLEAVVLAMYPFVTFSCKVGFTMHSVGMPARDTPSLGRHERHAWIRLISCGQEMQQQLSRTMKKRS